MHAWLKSVTYLPLMPELLFVLCLNKQCDRNKFNGEVATSEEGYRAMFKLSLPSAIRYGSTLYFLLLLFPPQPPNIR